MSEESIDLSGFVRGMNVRLDAVEKTRKRLKEIDEHHEKVMKSKEEFERLYDRERGIAVFLSNKLSLFGLVGAAVIGAVSAYTEVDMMGVVFALAFTGLHAEIMAARKMADAGITRSMITECAVALASMQHAKDSLVRGLAQEEAVRNFQQSMGERND